MKLFDDICFVVVQHLKMDVREKIVKSDDGDELDRISALPLHLREYILEFLPIKDAMITSIFSSSWRYCWIGMRGFDLKDMGLDRSADVEVFRKTIDRILLFCPIHFFNFFFPSTGNYLDVNLSDWFLVLSKKYRAFWPMPLILEIKFHCLTLFFIVAI